MWGLKHGGPVAIEGRGVTLVGTKLLGSFGISGGGGGGGYSNESDHDLAAMVSEFLEVGSAGVSESLSYSSSDSDSCFSDLAFLADKISFFKHSANLFESDLTLVVHSLILSMTEASHPATPDTCNAGCIRLSLVKLLQSSGYDAAVCTTKWQAFGKIPGGEHEFIDVINHQSSRNPERYIIDIDFRSNFEIARAVKPYDLVLNSLPSVYVGTLAKLKQFLKIMVEATTCSLKQNSMPLPPWRSLAYMEAKWESSCQRMFGVRYNKSRSLYAINHLHCVDLLKRVKSSVGSEIRSKTSMLQAKADIKWHHKNARKLHSSEWM